MPLASGAWTAGSLLGERAPLGIMPMIFSSLKPSSSSNISVTRPFKKGTDDRLGVLARLALRHLFSEQLKARRSRRTHRHVSNLSVTDLCLWSKRAQAPESAPIHLQHLWSSSGTRHSFGLPCLFDNQLLCEKRS
jgi:hypothetical protein